MVPMVRRNDGRRWWCGSGALVAGGNDGGKDFDGGEK